MVTFTFDDGFATDYTVLKPVFDARGVVGVSGVIASYVGTGAYLSWGQIQELQAAGWEIADHSNTHAPWDTISAPAMQAEIDNVRIAFAANGITQPENFIYPGGGYCDRAQSVLASNGYRSARDNSGAMNEFRNINKIFFNKYVLSSFYIEDHTQLQYYKNIIDVLTTADQWVIFFAHQTDANDASTIGNLIDYIQSKGIPIVTLSQAMNIVEQY